MTYDGKLLARLPADAQDGPVARLCRRSTDGASAAAFLLEAWVDRFDAPAKCRADITSPNSSAFWSALWELTTAAALSSIGFAIDLRARLSSGRTPDLIVERDGLRTMVEVFVVQNDAETAHEHQILNVAARALHDRLDLPAGTFLSLTCLKQVRQQPSEDALDSLAHAITSWLQEAPPTSVFEHQEEDLPVHGAAMFGHSHTHVAWVPAGGVLNQMGRVRDRLTKKIERYAPSVTEDLHLTVAVCEGGWKITEHQMITALYGNLGMQLGTEPGEVLGASYDGSGAAVVGGPHGAHGAESFSGAWYLSGGGRYKLNPPRCDADVSYLHSPYCLNPLPAGSLHPVRELQVQGDSLLWAGEPLTLSLQ